MKSLEALQSIVDAINTGLFYFFFIFGVVSFIVLLGLFRWALGMDRKP